MPYRSLRCQQYIDEASYYHLPRFVEKKRATALPPYSAALSSQLHHKRGFRQRRIARCKDMRQHACANLLNQHEDAAVAPYRSPYAVCADKLPAACTKERS